MLARVVLLRLTGDLLDLVDHHKGVRQAHLHRVIDRADLWHLSGDLKEKKGKSITRATTVALGQTGLTAPIYYDFPQESTGELCIFNKYVAILSAENKQFTDWVRRTSIS